MQVTVQVDPRLARELHGPEQRSSAARDLVTAVQDAGGEIHPTHPGTDDETLAPFFTVEVADDRCEQLRQVIASTEGVEAAYVKPPDELP